MPPTTTQRQQRVNPSTNNTAENEAGLATRGEPLGAMDRPIATNEPHAKSANTRNAMPSREGRGFTTTFAIAAVVLLTAFLIALYLGSQGTDTTTTTGNTEPVTETVPAVPNNATVTTDTPGAADTAGTTPATGTAGAGTAGTNTP